MQEAISTGTNLLQRRWNNERQECNEREMRRDRHGMQGFVLAEYYIPCTAFRVRGVAGVVLPGN